MINIKSMFANVRANAEEITMRAHRSFTRDGIDFDIVVSGSTVATYNNADRARGIINSIKEAIRQQRDEYVIPYDGPIVVAFN